MELLASGRLVLVFDTAPAASQYAIWQFVAPQGLANALSAVITLHGEVAGTASIVLEAQLEAVSSGDAIGSDSFGTANSATQAMPASAGNTVQTTITLTNDDGIAAGDLVRLRLTRAYANGSDTYAGKVYVHPVELREA